MSRFSIRWVVLVPVLATVAIGFTVFAIYVDRIEYSSRISELDEELFRAQRQTSLRLEDQRPRPGLGEEEPPERDDRLFDQTPDQDGDDGEAEDPPVELLVAADGTVLAQNVVTMTLEPSDIAWLAERDGFYTVADGALRAKVLPQADDTVLITALSLESTNEAASSFRIALVTGGLVIMALLGLVLWGLAWIIARPVTQLTATANRIAGGELDVEIAPSASSRETADLGTDLELMLGRIRQTLDESERHADDATSARDAMRRLLADMSHELRTPLTALKGYSDLYEKGMLETESDVDRAMGRIGSESERLANLVNDMLQLTRGNAVETPSESVELQQVAGAVAEDLAVANQGVDVSMRIEGDPPPVAGSPDRLHQALLNLGSNACRFTEAGGAVEFVIEEADGGASVSVVDHGPGIPDELVDKVFLPFFRTDEARDRDGRDGASRDGAGLGLAIVRQIATDHGGSVVHQPTDGGGATFVFTVPELVLSDAD